MLRVARTFLAGLALVGLLIATAPSASAAGSAPSTAPAPATTPMTAAAIANSTSGGNAFDTCTAPTTAQMSAWLASPYRSVGIYIGGEARGCAQPNLTKSWVTTVTGQGWGLLPIYVGRQAPCYGGSKPMSATPATAAAQGVSAAKDALTQLSALGISSLTPVYFDMEPYDTRIASCVAAVKAFTNAWTTTLQASGRSSGIYGATGSMILNLVAWRTDPTFHQPDEIWFSHWTGTLTTDDPAIPADAWSGHRVHQYAAAVKETYGGVTLTIDRNVISASMLTPITPARLYDSGTATVGTAFVSISVGGHAGIPSTATAAVLTVQVINPTAAGSLVVAPYLSTSVIPVQQFAKGQTMTQTVVVPLNQRAIRLRLTAGAARVTVTTAGYFAAASGSRLTAMNPSRLYDSGLVSVGTAPVTIPVAGSAGVPSTATAVAVTVSVVNPTAAGGVIASGYTIPSNVVQLPFVKGQTVSTTMLIPLQSGKIQLRLTAGKARVQVTTAGYVAPTGSRITTLVPLRLYDSVSASVGATPVAVAVAGAARIPANATAVIAVVQIVGPTAAGSLIASAYTIPSNVVQQQFAKGENISATVLVPLHSGKIQLKLTAGNARVLVSALAFLAP